MKLTNEKLNAVAQEARRNMMSLLVKGQGVGVDTPESKPFERAWTNESEIEKTAKELDYSLQTAQRRLSEIMEYSGGTDALVRAAIESGEAKAKLELLVKNRGFYSDLLG